MTQGSTLRPDCCIVASQAVSKGSSYSQQLGLARVPGMSVTRITNVHAFKVAPAVQKADQILMKVIFDSPKKEEKPEKTSNHFLHAGKTIACTDAYKESKLFPSGLLAQEGHSILSYLQHKVRSPGARTWLKCFACVDCIKNIL